MLLDEDHTALTLLSYQGSSRPKRPATTGTNERATALPILLTFC